MFYISIAYSIYMISFSMMKEKRKCNRLYVINWLLIFIIFFLPKNLPRF